MAITDYYNCNCCLYIQELDAERFSDIKMLPEEDKEDYINCHFRLCEPLKDDEPEYNLKHRNSTGCFGWTCSICGGSSKHGHEKCWSGC